MGSRVWKRHAAEKFDLVITDLNMPLMDGIEMITGMRKLPAYSFTPILMLTTESQAEKKDAGRKAGATGWIVKPFQAEQLIAVVQKLVPLALGGLRAVPVTFDRRRGAGR